jgi:hypothetical protein
VAQARGIQPLTLQRSKRVYAARKTLTGSGAIRRFGAFFTFTSSSRSTA